MAARSLSGIMRARRTFHAAHAGVRIERQDQNVAEAARLFEETNVAGMKQVIAAVGKDHQSSPGVPEGTLFDQFRAAVEWSTEPPV